MMKFIALVFGLYFQIVPLEGFPQSDLSVDTVWFQRENRSAEILTSRFPVVKSNAHPAAATAINTLLQMQELGGLMTNVQKNSLSTATDATQSAFDFKIISKTSSAWIVDILHVHRKKPGSYRTSRRYYFDAVSGQGAGLEIIFSPDGFNKIDNLITPLLQKDAVDLMTTHFKDLQKTLASQEGKDCIAAVAKAFCDHKIRLSIKNGDAIFEMDDCDWINPRQHELYSSKQPLAQLEAFLSPYGKYFLKGGDPVFNDSPFYQLWTGAIDGKVPVTFHLEPTCSSFVTGFEIRDETGPGISLRGTLIKNQLTLDELDGDKPVARFSGTIDKSKITGTWVKLDGSKPVSFEAILADANTN